MSIWLRRVRFFVATSGKRKIMATFAIMLYVVYVICGDWTQQADRNRGLLIDEEDEVIEKNVVEEKTKGCEDESVCKQCPAFAEKITLLRKCINGAARGSALLGQTNGLIRIISSGNGARLQLRHFVDIGNVTAACNRAYFEKQTNLMQLVTLNGPKIGHGKGTQLFLASHDFLLPCNVGSVGMGTDITIEYQIKQAHPSCKILAFNENVKESKRLIEGTLGGESYGAILTKPDSEEADVPQIISAVTSGFGKDTADVLFIRPYFTTESLLTFLDHLTAKKPDVCQLNVRIRDDLSHKYEKDTGILSPARKFIQSVVKTSWFLFHSDLRGHEQQAFFINVDNLLCARKFFAHSCLPFDFP
uniref:Methyltransf_21 domain-containing protein n=1 Tax=Panagrellus redivivus TaxID=6233 RepID=A0A7E4VI67_PANRE